MAFAVLDSGIGVHAFWLHPFSLQRHGDGLYGFPWDVRLWTAFFVHDLGYWKSTDMEGQEGETHVYMGARILRWLLGDAWGEFCLRHSRIGQGSMAVRSRVWQRLTSWRSC
jgi:hypothetical protein